MGSRGNNKAGLFPHALGSELIVHTSLKESVRGIFFGFDDALQMAVIQQEYNGALSFVLLNVSEVKSVECVNAKPSPQLLTSLPKPDRVALILREEASLEKQTKLAAKLGQNVSTEAQRIFDNLSKLFPCEWDKDRIVVLGNTIIHPPYNSDCVKGDKGSEKYIQKALENARDQQ
eukprot:c1099_g1_i2.p1 GENE.c1099_g1_i2~~c1099_g1_i2.p1  ORF type:complete len:196 (-),score=43.66 c1099_g1_i2:56-580(-)